jgi:hypothetical protein
LVQLKRSVWKPTGASFAVPEIENRFQKQDCIRVDGCDDNSGCARSEQREIPQLGRCRQVRRSFAGKTHRRLVRTDAAEATSDLVARQGNPIRGWTEAISKAGVDHNGLPLETGRLGLIADGANQAGDIASPVSIS